MGRIGILGGTFNPVHTGHLLLAEWARDALGLDEVWFIPTGHSYMKADDCILPGEERLWMVRLAIQDNPFFQCLGLEIERKGNSYSYETLEQLKSMHPENELFFIVGADCLFTIEEWRCVERIFQSCTLVAAVRDDASLDTMREKKRELEQHFPARIILLPFLRTSVSSTEIRERIREGKSVRYLVPEAVLKYIGKKGYYRE